MPNCRRCGHPLRSGLSHQAGLGRICRDKPLPQHPATLLDDILATFGAGEDKLWSLTICARLAGIAPDLYDGWTPVILAAALKERGVTTRQTWGPAPVRAKRNRSGVRREDVSRALGSSGRVLDPSGPASGESAP
jgi:hypothetical protein